MYILLEVYADLIVTAMLANFVMVFDLTIICFAVVCEKVEHDVYCCR